MQKRIYFYQNIFNIIFNKYTILLCNIIMKKKINTFNYRHVKIQYNKQFNAI